VCARLTDNNSMPVYFELTTTTDLDCMDRPVGQGPWHLPMTGIQRGCSKWNVQTATGTSESNGCWDQYATLQIGGTGGSLLVDYDT
jgi:hypothetical protein